MKPLLFLPNLLLLIVADPPLNGPLLFFDDKRICQKDVYCGKEPNTWCKTKCKRAPGCAFIEANMEKFRSDVLEGHNDFRNAIANGSLETSANLSFLVAAANMNALVYDFELEAMVGCNLARCDRQHDPCRKTPKYPHGPTQNLCGRGQSNYDSKLVEKVDGAQMAIWNWFDMEKGNVKNEDLFVDGYHKQTDPINQYVHFTTAIWWSQDRIGCSRYWQDVSKGPSSAQKWNQIIIGCNYANSDGIYGNAANMIKKQIYEKGKACTKCPKGSPCDPKSRFPALCGGGAFPKPRPPLLGGYGTVKPHVSSEMAIRSWTLSSVSLMGLSMALLL